MTSGNAAHNGTASRQTGRADDDPNTANTQPVNTETNARIEAPEQATPITVAYGDGIGPEIMEATLFLLHEAGARLDVETIDIGERVYRDGFSSGIRAEAWESLERTRLFLKAPISTPQGGGVKSLNVTIRKTLGLYANVRPCVSHFPFISTRHPAMDVVIVRENEEDLYAGIEHQQTDEVVQCLKLISVPGTERIVRHAFEYARHNNRRTVACFTKDNIMKMTDGLFHRIFNEVAEEYPDIRTEHWIIDIGAARLAHAPEQFDVIVMPNLYGDILSDVAAQISGSVGIGPSANIGERFAMFEAIHGSAPPIAGRDIANPSGLLLSGVMLLAHIGQNEAAARLHNAWLRTIERGIHTADIAAEGPTTRCVGTREFARQVARALGSTPVVLRPVSYAPAGHTRFDVQPRHRKRARKELVGVDLFVHWTRTADELAAVLRELTETRLETVMITNRGVKVWPDGNPATYCTDHWRCRMMAPDRSAITHMEVGRLLIRAAAQGLDFIKTENLCTFDGAPGFSLGQGQ